jgi:hypothetical protein
MLSCINSLVRYCSFGNLHKEVERELGNSFIPSSFKNPKVALLKATERDTTDVLVNFHFLNLEYVREDYFS